MSPDPQAATASVEVILPCLNEVAGLAWVLERMPAGFIPLVVDNGSTDGTVELARASGVRVVSATRRGYGAACHAGLEAATAPVVAVMDADASLDPSVLPAAAEPVLTGMADLVVGRRRASSTAAFSWPLRLANAEVARRIRRRTGVQLHDIGPIRVARREPLLALGLTDRRSGYPAETVVLAADAGWRIVPFDVDYRPRLGRSKVTGTPLGVWRAVQDMSAAIAAPPRNPSAPK